MTQLSPDAFADPIAQYWHGRPPSCLEDVLTMYGVLATAEDDGELFRTSSKLDGFVDEGRLVTVHVDLTATPTGYVDTTVDRLRDQHVERLGYSAKTSGRGADYSITQAGSNSGNSPETIASTHLGTKLRRWCEYDSVRGVINDHPDGWVVEALGEVFEKDSKTIEEIAGDIESILSGTEPTVLTVELTLDSAELDESTDQGVVKRYPGELDVLELAMRRYKTANMTDRNLDSRTSEGEARSLVTGEDDRVVGTPESPLETFSIKHPDVQPGLRRTASWRNYPIDEQTGQLIAKSADLVEKCVFRHGGMETYAIPYFASELTPAKAALLYNAVQSLDPDSEGDQPPMARVTYDITESDDEAVRALADELRFHYVTLPIGDDTHVVAEAPTATTYWVNELAKALVDTVFGPTRTREAGGFEPSENWPLLDFAASTDSARKQAFGRIVGYDFIDATFARRDDEVGDDFRRVATQRLIEGRPISTSVLFGEYCRRLGDEFDGEAPPWQLPAMQFIQLEALSRAGLLDDFDPAVEPHDDTMTDQITATDIDTIRTQRLESFLDRPMFTPEESSESAQRTAAERRAAFLSGVFVGQVSWHQENERSIGTPLDARTQADKLTPRVLEQTIRSALDDARIYASESEYDSDVLYPEVVDRLLDALERQPTEWGLEKSELQFLVALGQSYGRRAMPIAFDIRNENSTTDSTAEPAATEEA